MASVMGICGGLVGPKSGNVGFSLVLIVFFEGSRGPRARQRSLRLSEPGGFDVKNMILLIKNVLCLYLKICFPLQREAYFQKNHEKMLLEVQNGATILSDTLKYHQHGVGYMNMAKSTHRRGTSRFRGFEAPRLRGFETSIILDRDGF